LRTTARTWSTAPTSCTRHDWHLHSSSISNGSSNSNSNSNSNSSISSNKQQQQQQQQQQWNGESDGDSGGGGGKGRDYDAAIRVDDDESGHGGGTNVSDDVHPGDEVDANNGQEPVLIGFAADTGAADDAVNTVADAFAANDEKESIPPVGGVGVAAADVEMVATDAVVTINGDAYAVMTDLVAAPSAIRAPSSSSGHQQQQLLELWLCYSYFALDNAYYVT
jgi:hypothetical protein